MATAIGDLVARLRMDTTGFQRGARGAMGTMKMMTGAAARMTSMFIGGGGVVYGLMRAGRAANEFGGAMNRSLAIMTDVTADMRSEMEALAHTVASTTQFSATEAARAYFYLASAGLDAAKSMASLETVARFAQAGNFDLALATDLATDAQSALGLKAEDTDEHLRNLTRVTDVLVKANTVANASVQQFSEAITNKAGAAMRMYGIEMEEGMAILAAFADQGIKGADAGTKFGIVIRDLTTKAILNKNAFKAAGIEVFRFGEVRNLADIIEDLENKLGGMSDELKKTTLLQLGFTDKSVSAVAALLGYSDMIREVEQKLNAAGGTVDDVASKSLTAFTEAWNEATASMQAAATSGFTPILDKLAEMIDKLNEATPGIESLSGEARKTGEQLVWMAEMADKLNQFTILGHFERYSKLLRDIVLEVEGFARDPLGRQAATAAEAAAMTEVTGAAARGRAKRAAAFAGSAAMPVSPEERAKQQVAAQIAAEKIEWQKGEASRNMNIRRMAHEAADRFRQERSFLTPALMPMDQILAESDPRASKRGGPRFAGAMERGSAGAISTILQAGKGGEKTAKEHLRVGKQQVAVLNEISGKIEIDMASIPPG